MGKRQRKFPNEDDGRIHKKRKRAVLKFAGEIAADPGIRTQEGPVAFDPTARHIGEHWQDRYFIIVVPKNERIMPEKDQAEENDNQARTDCAQEISPLINTDFHRCRKRNLLVRVSSVFIRG